ncbi:benzoate/H(+) symporter BenE family transporter [Luteimonas huabeiensis]|uniref:benzoate/H(+) symporter BenE family transporter n=1 Tax=Luteimonas huabeiensis TaxID=1244513 RepID=UPI0004AE66B8|nr:benzoate/H(+) symporter BenE family transporter [Luteimonas huabeiensis]
MARLSRLLADASVTAVVAGVVSTLISFAGPLVIVIQAAEASGLDPAQTSSWVWSLALGSGVLCIALSLRLRIPVIIAWSIPGSALLVALLPELGLAQAVGAYLVAGAIVLATGLSGVFDRIVSRIPGTLAAAVMAGILFSFGTATFAATDTEPLLVLSMFAAYLAGRRWWPPYAVLGVLLTGSALAIAGGGLDTRAIAFGWATPVWIAPEFTWRATLNLALPLVIGALSGQYVTGLAALRAAGYAAPSRPLVVGSAAGSLLLAPFGCHGLNPAAVTAAMCLGPDAHPDPARRYVAGVAAGAAYVVLGLLGVGVVSLFAALPTQMAAALAGLALFGAIAASVAGAMQVPREREAALVGFLATASGMSLLGLSAPFWGFALGAAAYALLGLRRDARMPAAVPGSARRAS